jgi:hypothetical protein
MPPPVADGKSAVCDATEPFRGLVARGLGRETMRAGGEVPAD